MKDAKGTELKLEDSILFTYWRCADMYEGTIIRITLKTIIIKSRFYGTYSIRKSNLAHRVVKI